MFKNFVKCFCAAAVLLLLVESMAFASNVIIYSEIFPNGDGAAAGDQPLSEADWYINKDDGTAAIGQNMSYAASNVTFFNPVNSNPLDTSTIVYGFMLSVDPQNNVDYLHWTDEYTIDRDLWDIDYIRWNQANSSTDDPTRLAVKVNNQWYASDAVSNVATADNWEMGSIQDFASATWTTLDFTPDVELALGTQTGLALPDGDITGFGLYCDNRSGVRLRYDAFLVVGEAISVPEPSVLIIIFSAVLAGCFFRKK